MNRPCWLFLFTLWGFSMDAIELTFDTAGLIPAIIQDADSGEVLMLAYMNRESLEKTAEKGETYFWSRSRQALWHKGGTSGHIQKVKSVAADCDGDALLVKVEQVGNACHTGERSCFFQDMTPGGKPPVLGEVLGSLSRVIHDRNEKRPSGSYTTRLLEGGIDKILKKVGEESGEVIIAAKNHSRAEIRWEVADLLYHLLVMLEHEGVTMAEVGVELEGRFVKGKKQEGEGKRE